MKRSITHHIYTANLLEFRDCAYVYMIDGVCNISYNSVFWKRKAIVFSDLEHLLILINLCKKELENGIKSM
jgi:hypothetical protein